VNVEVFGGGGFDGIGVHGDDTFGGGEWLLKKKVSVKHVATMKSMKELRCCRW
jgi:hypothetical protein